MYIVHVIYIYLCIYLNVLFMDKQISLFVMMLYVQVNYFSVMLGRFPELNQY